MAKVKSSNEENLDEVYSVHGQAKQLLNEGCGGRYVEHTARRSYEPIKFTAWYRLAAAQLELGDLKESQSYTRLSTYCFNVGDLIHSSPQSDQPRFLKTSMYIDYKQRSGKQKLIVK